MADEARRRWRPGRHAVVAAAVLVLVAGGSARSGPPARAAATGSSPTGQYTNGTVLPNGRRVTPAGRTIDLGDLPLGVAISPDGALAVAIDSGQGFGLHHGKESYCTPDQSTPTTICPYFSASPPPGRTSQNGLATRGDAATQAPDEQLSVVDLRSGAVTVSKARDTATDPAVMTNYATDTGFNYFYVGVAFSPDGRHLYAAGGGNDAVYDFPVDAADVVAARPARTVVLPHQAILAPGCNSPISGVCSAPGLGLTAGYTRQIAVSPDGRTLAVSHQFNNTVDLVDTAAFDAAHTIQVHLAIAPQAYPAGLAFPGALAYSPDGGTLFVACEAAGVVTALSTAQPAALQRVIVAGDHPAALAVSPDGAQLYVVNANDDTLDVVDTTVGATRQTLVLHALPGEALGSIPDAVAISPDAQRLYVALAGDDAVAVLGTAASFAATGSTPPAAAAPSGSPAPPPPASLPAAAVGVTGLPNTAAPAPPPIGSWVVGGLLPAGWYPSALGVTADGATLVVADAKGLGSRNLGSARRGDVVSSYEYVGHNMPGLLQVVSPPPTGAALDRASAQVQDDLLAAGSADTRPAHSAIPAEPGGGGPITHVIEVVRENRTFDQVFGDLPADTGRPAAPPDSGIASAVDAAAQYAIFGRDVTPNAHALLGDATPCAGGPCPGATATFAGADNLYADGEISNQGHWWTTAATATDYLERSWPQYYSPRGHLDDNLGIATAPHNCTIFQAALQKGATAPGFSLRVYGETTGILNPSVGALAGGIVETAPNPCQAIPNSVIDLADFPTQTSFEADARTQAAEFLSDSGINADGTLSSDPTKQLRTLSYLILPTDHTQGLRDSLPTPRAYVAQNDVALGSIVAAVSRSPYWSSTAILVMEDDDQDGLDHEDGHRDVPLVISPYAKHGVTPAGVACAPGASGCIAGFVGHRHYSQASVMKTIELLLGLPHLSAYDQNASALYDLFQSVDAAAQLTPADLKPFTPAAPPPFIDEMGSCYTHPGSAGATGCVPGAASVASTAQYAALAEITAGLDLSRVDRAGPELEVVAWSMARPGAAVPDPLLVAMARSRARALGVDHG